MLASATVTPGAYLGGLWGPGPPGSPKGRQKEREKGKGKKEKENVTGAKLTEKRTRGAPCSFKCKHGLQGRKRQEHQIDREKDKRGAMQFQEQAGSSGKKTSGAPN